MSQPSFVYFIAGGGFVKIGVSTDPQRRLHHLRVASPVELTLLAAYPGTVREETMLHRLLREHRHRGEWFRACQAIEDIVRDGLPRIPGEQARPHKQKAVPADLPKWKLLLLRAVEIAGSQAKLSERMVRCGFPKSSQSKLSWLMTKGEWIDADTAVAIHHATNGEVAAHHLRPDLWPTKYGYEPPARARLFRHLVKAAA